MKRVVLYLGPEEGAAWVAQELGTTFELRHAHADVTSVRALLPQANVLLDASMKVPLDAEMLAKAKTMELVITATTGADHIDHKALEQRCIPLLTLKTEREVLAKVNAAAELSWGLLMACARKMGSAFSHVRDGLWERTEFPGAMLRGKTLGIVGLGRNGGWCARYGTAFGMRITAHDPFATEWPDDVEKLSLDDLVRQADFLLVHVTYSEATRNLLNRKLVENCKPGAVWINTSRGAIWDEQALADMVLSGRLAGIGADVLAPEPDIRKSPLWQAAQEHSNILITPHIGGFSPDALETVLRHTAIRIRSHFTSP